MLRWTNWGNVGGMTTADDMFAYFQNHWTDLGSLMEWGWEWWFDGSYSGPTGSDWSKVDVAGGGFYSSFSFYDFFHKEAHDDQAMSAIDSYLRDGYGVTVGVYPEGESHGHAITCWGFNYDPNDPTSYYGIWVSDSDDDKGSSSPADRLRYYEIQESGGKWYLQDFYGADNWYIDMVQALEQQPGNHRPVLTSPTLTPLSGTAADSYVFSVHYYDQDGDPPMEYGGEKYARLYLAGGRVEEMSLVSGSPANGTYRCSISDLAPGNYQHFFSFIDSGGGGDAVSGWHPGPYVDMSPGSDLARSNGRWDDGTASGDDDGVVEAGEAVKTQVLIRSAQGASNVEAWLSTTEPDIRITQPYVYFDDFSPGQQQWPMGWFALSLDFDLSPGQTRSCHFTLSTTYELDGVQYAQEIPFTKTVYHDGDISARFAVTGFTIDDSASISYR